MTKIENVGICLGAMVQSLVRGGALNDAASLLGKGTGNEHLQKLFVMNEDTCADMDALCLRATLQRGVEFPSSPKVRVMAFLRCTNALDFVGALMEPDQTGVLPFCDSDAIGQERLLRWMLVGMWNRRYDHWLQQAARGWSTGDLYPKPEGLF